MITCVERLLRDNIGIRDLNSFFFAKRDFEHEKKFLNSNLTSKKLDSDFEFNLKFQTTCLNLVKILNSNLPIIIVLEFD